MTVDLDVAPGRLPLAFQTVVDPAAVLINLSVHTRPVAKGRPRENRRTGVWYTPQRTREAEEAWRWIYRSARSPLCPVAVPVGLTVFFRTPDERRIDGDNCVKLLADAGNGIVWTDDSLIRESHIFVTYGCEADFGVDLLVWTRPSAAAAPDLSRLERP